jgi:hypothetical protein
MGGKIVCPSVRMVLVWHRHQQRKLRRLRKCNKPRPDVRHALTDVCILSKNCAEVFFLRSDKMKNKKQRSARIQFAAMNFLRVILARKAQKCA